ncbi:ATP-binding cassette domain-containing protein [Leucothrix mucor]|uniref:ATP-binding cassette domain-containing protein n=1 Tax=Leucothrix mucor TaxID=45248 RepID=UPI0003B4DBD2|nr:ATP-binding cassette domain-containing protein [Leucothrix mucor]
MLEIDHLEVRWKEVALKYNFTVDVGEILTIQGRSGVGKTTLLNAIAGFEAVDQGDIRWDGRSIAPLKVTQRPVSMLFQEHNLFEHLSVWQNLQFGLVSDDIEQRIRVAAEVLEVSDQLDKSPLKLSGGQRQRIAILRTLLRPEPIVLLDEPFAELDATTRLIANDWVRETAKATNKTVLLITHQDEDVARVGDRNLLLS